MPVGTRFFARPDRLCTMGTKSFPGVEAAGSRAEPHPHLKCPSPRKSRVISLLTLKAFVPYKKVENLPKSDLSRFVIEWLHILCEAN